MNNKIKNGNIAQITSAILLSSCALLFSLALGKPSSLSEHTSSSHPGISANPYTTASLQAPNYITQRHATTSASTRNFIEPAIAGVDQINHSGKDIDQKLPPSRAVGAIFTMPVIQARQRNHREMT